MRTAIILPILGGLLMIGVATTATLNNKIERVEDKCAHRLERIEDKIDSQAKAIKELTVTIGRIEEKLD